MISNDAEENPGKILPCIKTERKYDGFRFNVKLKISFFSDAHSRRSEMVAASIATVVGQIIHKHRAWQEAGFIMFDTLRSKLADCPPATLAFNPFKWEVEIKVAGYHFAENFINDPPIVYDCVSHVGVLKSSESPSDVSPGSNNSASIAVNYTATFYLSPAVESAKPLYTAEGYSSARISNGAQEDFGYVSYAVEFMRDYNHQKVWEAYFEQLIKDSTGQV